MAEDDHKEFIVEVNIMLPKGEDLSDWVYVTRLSESVNEDTVSYDTRAISEKIAGEIRKALSESESPA